MKEKITLQALQHFFWCKLVGRKQLFIFQWLICKKSLSHWTPMFDQITNRNRGGFKKMLLSEQQEVLIFSTHCSEPWNQNIGQQRQWAGLMYQKAPVCNFHFFPLINDTWTLSKDLAQKKTLQLPQHYHDRLSDLFKLTFHLSVTLMVAGEKCINLTFKAPEWCAFEAICASKWKLH